MDKITGLIELLGEENNKKIKDKVILKEAREK